MSSLTSSSAMSERVANPSDCSGFVQGAISSWSGVSTNPCMWSTGKATSRQILADQHLFMAGLGQRPTITAFSLATGSRA